MVIRRSRLASTRSEDSAGDVEVVQKTLDYENLDDVEHEMSEIKKRTANIDQTSPFAIAMSAKHRTLTKRYLF